jgi:TRAP-type C4-dicarboxylate transport system permease small subunit
MKELIAVENFGHAMKRAGIQLCWFVVGAALVLGTVDLVRKALAWITVLHWSLGLIAAVLVLAGLLWLLSYIKMHPLRTKILATTPSSDWH